MSDTGNRPPAGDTTFRDGPWHTADRDLDRLIADLQHAREDVRLEAQAAREHPGLFTPHDIESAQTERALAINNIAERLQHVASQLATGRDPARVRLAELAHRPHTDPVPESPTPPVGTKRVIATFHPQAWQDDHSVPVDPRGTVQFDVTEEVLALGRDRAMALDDDSYESDALRSARLAPAWVKDWQGPFYVEVRQAIEEFFETHDRPAGLADYAQPWSAPTLTYLDGESSSEYQNDRNAR